MTIPRNGCVGPSRSCGSKMWDRSRGPKTCNRDASGFDTVPHYPVLCSTVPGLSDTVCASFRITEARNRRVNSAVQSWNSDTQCREQCFTVWKSMTSRLRVLGPRYRLRVLELGDRGGPARPFHGRSRVLDLRDRHRTGIFLENFFIDLYKLTYIIKK